jgi:hypothetical protein
MVGSALHSSRPVGYYYHIIDNAAAGEMTSDAESSFKCPTCDALYQVVKINAGQEAIGRETTCQVCGAQFPAQQGKLISNIYIAESWPSPKNGGSEGVNSSLPFKTRPRRNEQLFTLSKSQPDSNERRGGNRVPPCIPRSGSGSPSQSQPTPRPAKPRPKRRQ